MKGLVNIQNEEYEYFIWYFGKILKYCVNKNPVIIRNRIGKTIQ